MKIIVSVTLTLEIICVISVNNKLSAISFNNILDLNL